MPNAENDAGWLSETFDWDLAQAQEFVDRVQAGARAEALEVAALLLGKVRDYWDGRPVEHHGHHIYADLLDVLRGIEADAKHNRTRVIPPGGSNA